VIQTQGRASRLVSSAVLPVIARIAGRDGGSEGGDLSVYYSVCSEERAEV
jgi:hypothetical protein